MGTIAKLLIGVAAAIFLAVRASSLYAKWKAYRFARKAPLAAGLPGNAQQATTEFQTRICARFPIGAPQSELVEILAAQGFQFEQGNGRNAKPYRRMHLIRPGVCTSDWYVSWQADAGGKLTEVSAEYLLTGS